MEAVEFVFDERVLCYNREPLSVEGASGRVYHLSKEFPYDPEALQREGIVTREDVLKVWLDIRGNLSDVVLWNMANSMSMYTDRDVYEVKTLKIRGLSRYMDDTQGPALDFRTGGRSYESARRILILGDESQEEQLPRFYLDCVGFQGRVWLRRSTRSLRTNPSTQWNKKWNYTKKMDSDEYNFYRTLKGEGADNVMFGMELEVSTKLSCEEIQEIVTDVRPKQEPFFIFKQDSSISGQYSNNVELVTVPCSPKYLKKAWKLFFNKVHKLCAAKGLEIKDVFDVRNDLSNGIHIHVSKSTFLNKLHKRKFVAAWNSPESNITRTIQRISGRPFNYTDNHYCTPNYRFDTKLARRLQMDTNGRATCHELSRTVEVRVFQGIVDIDHIIRCIEATEAMYYMVLSLPISKFTDYPELLEEFVHKNSGYNKLKEFFACA